MGGRLQRPRNVRRRLRRRGEQRTGAPPDEIVKRRFIAPLEQAAEFRSLKRLWRAVAGWPVFTLRRRSARRPPARWTIRAIEIGTTRRTRGVLLERVAKGAEPEFKLLI